MALTLAGFIAWETQQSSKHEFRAGAVYAMAGATDDHNQIVANLMAIVRPTLRGGPCRVYASDMRLLTDYPGSRYPDMLVTCDSRDASQRRNKRHPKLIIEVVSHRLQRSTRATNSTNIKRSSRSKSICSSTRVNLRFAFIVEAANF